MPPQIKKDIHFQLDQQIWSQLCRIFPLQGERTNFFRQCAMEAVRMGPSSRFVTKLRTRIEEDE